jgi:hypothetical protein
MNEQITMFGIDPRSLEPPDRIDLVMRIRDILEARVLQIIMED